MCSYDEQQDTIADPDTRELRLLSEVLEDPEASQRVLSNRVGIALGLTNLLLKKLAQRGYIKVANAGWKRRIYSLTPDGFTRILRLTVRYVAKSLESYREVRVTLRKEIATLALNSESSVAIYGSGDFAELVYLGLREIGIEEITIYDSKSRLGETFLGLPIRDSESLELGDYDRVIIASLNRESNFNKSWLKDGFNDVRIVTFFDQAVEPAIAKDGD